MRNIIFANVQPRRTGMRKAAETILSACGYCFDIARIRDSSTPDERRYRYEFYVYDPILYSACYDADSYEEVKRGQTERHMAWFDVSVVAYSRKWLYGHSGFGVMSASSYGGDGGIGDFPEEHEICSESECFGMFVGDMLSGYLDGALPRLPKIRSWEELRLWLAVNGK